MLTNLSHRRSVGHVHTPGINRSAALAISYLLVRDRPCLYTLFSACVSVRPAILQNPSFQLQLCDLADQHGLIYDPSAPPPLSLPLSEPAEAKAEAKGKAEGESKAMGQMDEDKGELAEKVTDELQSEGKSEAGEVEDVPDEDGAGTGASASQRERLLGDVVGTANSHIHNLVWNEEGELWAFGCGSGGRCGVGYYVIGANPSKPRKSRMKAYMSGPNRVGGVWPPTPEVAAAMKAVGVRPLLEGKRVVSACASRYHGCALVMD